MRIPNRMASRLFCLLSPMSCPADRTRSPRRSHRHPPLRRLRALLCVLIAGVASQALAASALAAPPAKQASRHARSAARHAKPVSSYPAGVSRPRAHPNRSPFAHGAASTKKKPAKKKPRKPVLHGNPARALRAFEAMQKYYYIQGSGLYAGEPFSFLWPFSQALAATVSMANIPHLGVSFANELHARLVGLRSYLDTNNSGAPEGTYTSTLAAFDGTAAPPTGPGGAKYYDDNDWVGIELARIYKQTHNAGALGYAEGIMAFEMAGFSSDQTLACPGGIPFTNRSKTPIATPSPRLPRPSSRCSSTRSPATSSTCSSPKWPTTGCAPACCSRTACTPTTSARTAWSTRPSGATTRER